MGLLITLIQLPMPFIMNNLINWHFIFNTDFKTVVGSYTISGLHVLPIWLYGLQNLKLIHKTFGSQVIQFITLFLVTGRLTCFAVEVSVITFCAIHETISGVQLNMIVGRYHDY